MLQLRGHHLFCLIGFRGMGYSEEYADNMKKVHAQLRQNPHTPFQLIAGADDLCAKFPCDQPYHCDAERVAQQDAVFLQKLQLKIGDILTWQEVEQRVKNSVTPAVIGEVCFDCSWREYGVCEEGVDHVQHNKGLFPVI